MKRVISLFMALIMMFSLAACAKSGKGGSSGNTEPSSTSATTKSKPEEPATEDLTETDTTTAAPQETPATTTTNTTANTPVNVEVTMKSFDEELIKYVDELGMKNKNYMISPLSFRAALCLAIAGAEGTTKAELLKACGFANQAEADAWYKHLLKIENEFKNTPGIGNGSDLAFSIVNSVWNNNSFHNDFSDSYKNYVTKNYSAEVRSENAGRITDAVNKWCKEKTNGLIPSIADDLSKVTAVLVNALYLKTSWNDPFPEAATHKDTFTGFDGKKKNIQFMEQTNRFNVYQDKSTTIAVFPMAGKKYFVLVIGDNSDFDAKLKKAESKLAHVMMPKFETSATFDDKYLSGFLKANGVKLAFDTDKADFSTMCPTDKWHIDEIIQKDKIKVDEKGLEAAAVTAIMMKSSAVLNQDKPIEVIANKPFSYYIYSNLYDDDKELLFYGQYVSPEG